MKIKDLIRKLMKYNAEAEVTTPMSEDITISYIDNDGEFTRESTPFVFIEPADSCPLCSHNYMDDATETRMCSFYNLPCREVDECDEWEDWSSQYE